MFVGEAPVFEEGKLVSSRPEHLELSDSMWEVIEGCLKKVPSQRKAIGEVVVALETELRSG